MKIVIPGGSGQVGQVLARSFHSSGHDVIVLSRRTASTPWRTVVWDGVSLGPWTSELEAADAVIHLSGRSIQCRYTPRNRRDLLESRVVPTLLLGQAIRNCTVPPAVWLNASAANLYTPRPDRGQDEINGELAPLPDSSVPDTWNFAVELTRRWEDAFFSAQTPETRKIALRTSLLLSPDPGGVFSVLLRLVRLGLGGAQGPGTQYVSWMLDTDYVSAIQFLILTPTISGPVNMAAPQPTPNREFMRTLRQAWGMPFGLPAASWMIELGSRLAGTETELVLKSRRVIPGVLLANGFKFNHPTWADAAHDLVRRYRSQG